MRKVAIDGVALRAAPETEWSGAEVLYGQGEALELCRLALGVAPAAATAGPGPCFFPVLLGPPGVGKTTLAFQLAREAAAGRGVYAVQCHQDMLAEDLVVTPVLGQGRRVEYQMSPLATAAYRGAAVVLDEASRLAPTSWAAVLSAFDERRCLASVAAGITIPVRPTFRAILTMNRDAETHELPPAVRSRLGPFVPMSPVPSEHRFEMLRRTLRALPDAAIRKALLWVRAHERRGEILAPRALLGAFSLYERLVLAAPETADHSDLMARALASMALPEEDGRERKGQP